MLMPAAVGPWVACCLRRTMASESPTRNYRLRDSTALRFLGSATSTVDLGAPGSSRTHDIFNNSHPDHRSTSKADHTMSDNTVTLIGNITRDPRDPLHPGERAQTSFGLAAIRHPQPVHISFMRSALTSIVSERATNEGVSTLRIRTPIRRPHRRRAYLPGPKDLGGRPPPRSNRI